MKRNRYITDVGAFGLILLFVYAGSAKLFKLQEFQNQLAFYPWLKHATGLVAWLVPLSELAVTALLLSGRRLAGFYASLILLSLFTVYLIVMLGTEKHLPCSCGGVIAHLTWGQHVVFNLCFILLAILSIFAERNAFQNQKIHAYET